MRKGSWFAEITKSLRAGLFADRVILAIAKAQRNGGPIPESDRRLFDRASEFLADAIAGYKWMEKPSFSSSAASHASLFGQAVRAVSVSSAPDDFLGYLEDLKRVSDKLSAGQEPNPDEIIKLRGFFVNHSAAEMHRSDEFFRTPKPRGDWAWQGLD